MTTTHPTTLPEGLGCDLDRYDHIIVAFSGGKDSVASVLHLLELGVDRERIELWHHDVDGAGGSTLMDWPCTRQMLPPEKVDEFIDLFPCACEGCGSMLPKIPDLVPRRYQYLELLASRTHLTEFRRHEVLCERCGHRTLAPYDAHKIPPSSFARG